MKAMHYEDNENCVKTVKVMILNEENMKISGSFEWLPDLHLQ